MEQVVNGAQTCMGEVIMPEKKLLLGWGEIVLPTGRRLVNQTVVSVAMKAKH